MQVNLQVADKLRQAAELLAQQGANPFRVMAYRKAADTVASYPEDLRRLVERDGSDGLMRLPNIGRGIATAVYELLITGRWGQLERWRGSLDPEHLFRTLAGIGPKLARRMHDHLDVDTLEGLEIAAHDGRLEQVPGIGPERAEAIRSVLAATLARTRVAHPGPAHAPSVATLLDVDREYRDQARRGGLVTIAPKRFNPDGEAWLPILHTQREGRHFTALYSNTARAHQLGRTRDWVVIYWYDDQHHEGQTTVVTETRGPLEGQRVVRGREAECLEALLQEPVRHRRS